VPTCEVVGVTVPVTEACWEGPESVRIGAGLGIFPATDRSEPCTCHGFITNEFRQCDPFRIARNVPATRADPPMGRNRSVIPSPAA
jgi:hypothetical protein